MPPKLQSVAVGESRLQPGTVGYTLLVPWVPGLIKTVCVWFTVWPCKNLKLPVWFLRPHSGHVVRITTACGLVHSLMSGTDDDDDDDDDDDEDVWYCSPTSSTSS
jgi:hypothetical protein